MDGRNIDLDAARAPGVHRQTYPHRRQFVHHSLFFFGVSFPCALLSPLCPLFVSPADPPPPVRRPQDYHRDHFEVHGFNWYLCLLHAVLGLQLPLLPLLHDEYMASVADFWQALTPEAWDHFSDPRYFGVKFEGVKPLQAEPRTFLRQTVPLGTCRCLSTWGEGRADSPPPLRGKRREALFGHAGNVWVLYPTLIADV